MFQLLAYDCCLNGAQSMIIVRVTAWKKLKIMVKYFYVSEVGATDD